jgi:hypothetical protein
MRNGTALAALAAALISTLANAAPAPDGKNRKILLENVSSETIRELYAAPTTAKTWEENLLAQRTLEPGQSISANIDNGTTECHYDLKVVLGDGKSVEQRNIDVCAITKWVVGDSGNSIQ